MISNKLKLVLVLFLFLFIVNISYSLTTLTVTEEDLVKIEPLAVDPDEDEITYQYFDPLNESGEWQTDLDDAGTYNTQIVASDGNSQTEEELIIVVRNKNQPPEIEDKKIAVKEGETIDLKELISDPDEEDSLKLTFQEPFDNQGVWETTYSDAGTFQTEITVSDLEDRVTRVIEVEVINKNRLPEIISSFSESEAVPLTEDSTFEFSVSAQDEDGDNLVYSWQLGEKEVSQEASFEYYFDFDSAGEHDLILTIADQESEIEELWILEVKDVNRPPKVELMDIIVNEGEKIVLQLLETDGDGDLLTYTFPFPFDENGVWETTYDDGGEHLVAINVSDGELTVEIEVDITINEVDRKPLINLEDEMTINENEELLLDLGSLILDPDNDELKIDIQDLPEGAVILDNILEWQPSYDLVQRKSTFFTNLLNKLRIEKYFLFRNKKVDLFITACGKELCSEHNLKLQVNNVNRKPLLTEMEGLTFTELEVLRLDPQATDLDGDFIKYEFGEPFDSCGEWQTSLEDEGSYTVKVTASDGYSTDTKEVSLTVLNKNRQPTLEIVEDYFELNEDQPLSLNVNAFDPDNDDLIIRAENLPAGASFKDQTFSWIPAFDTVGKEEYSQFVVNFIASDEEFDVVHPVTFVVKDTNHIPEITDYSPAGNLITTVDEPVTFSITANDVDEDELMYRWDFGFWDNSIEGPDAIQRTFKTPGTKTVKVTVSDGSNSVEVKWNVEVKSLPGLSEPETLSLDEVEEVAEVIEEPQETQEVAEPKIEELEAPTPTCPEHEPCPKTAPFKPPFKVYVVSS
ncbi:hypothetical protein GOV03_01265 [Candidatus Woesearchaeota archaeon]|nr:hypothetical protein [Candidatus Woesearchaeota archaeon]